ncbi:DUF6984 family protein [Hymenobacter wooponensis]|uniref:DUF6984 domain-containing protein n=1 Tax=Hymenobacter wooponensis TaxID=1525360 RepID=A0A4Z0MCP5_9BACT|nr:hypothetical protein [Hymenobacter wooponensis]TGD77157.1 hypothetical protein EU557_24300 [Hymenobacter wooponensis]
MTTRLLTLPELGLLLYMLRGKPEAERLLAGLPTARVEELEDGGMGSLQFVSGKQNRRLGHLLATTWYTDADGVAVLASLYADADGELFELDSWKVDDSPLQRIPAF